MMTSHRSYVVFVLLLCTVQRVHNMQLRGRIWHNSGAESELKVTNYIHGEDFNAVQHLTIDRLMYADTLSVLTLANFNSIHSLILTNISLVHVPVFVNTRCTNIFITGNKITNVPARAFSGLQPSYLDLSKNEIESMDQGSVNIGATRVFLSCNKLKYFTHYWFEDPSSILSLDLSSNRYQFFGFGAFNQMTQLSMLDLSYNHMMAIGNEAFSSAITDLRLNFNNITRLTPDMFAPRTKLMSVLFLHHNRLSFLSEGLWRKLQPTFISLMGNPWQCRCLQDIERWLRERNTTRLHIPTRRDEPVCVVPRNFVDECIQVEDPELHETYAKGLSPMQGCLAEASRCKPCENLAETNLIQVT